MVKVKMRKRAQRKSKPITDQSKHVVTKKTLVEKPKKPTKQMRKNWWMAVALIGIFLLVLLFNAYFNIISGVAENPDGEGLEKYYLSGPDPYYNMRIVEETYTKGTYQFYSENDPLLNYPLGASGGRAPLFNMMALGFSRVLTPFMDEIDAIGYAMQFIPALFGALLVFPVYSIGKDVFNKKVGLISALWLSLTVAIVSSGHGSAYSLFDHDSFNLFLFFTTFAFLIKSIKEKDRTKSIFYAILGGIPLAGLSMVWVEHEYLYTIIALYAFVQIFIDLLKGKNDLKTFISPLVILSVGYIVSLPVISSRWVSFRATIPLFMCLGVLVFGLIYYVLGKRKVPWTISLPAILVIGGFGFAFLWFVPELSSVVPQIGALSKFSEIIRGTGGIYGNKVSLTIAEAHTYGISNTVMNFGAVLYWLGWAGFVFILYNFYKNRERNDLLFLITLFVVNIWLTGIAGRFITDMAPIIAIFAGFMTWFIVDRVDYPGMARNIKSAGGGFHGIRRGVKIMHVIGILFIAMALILNVIPVFTAAIPNAQTEDGDSNWKKMFWGDKVSHPFGLSIGKETYWVEAFQWLKQQDTDISDPVDRPAVISWWDYGFYEVAIGEHPTVADNFQHGIPPAANFHTATSEKEAIAVLSVRLMEGDAYKNERQVSEGVQDVLEDYFPDYAENISFWLENPEESPSYGKKIDSEYHKYIQNVDERFLTVGVQWEENAYYHDIVNLVTNETNGLSLDETVWFYHDIQEATGLSIRYYATEIYDKSIFNIFAFLADKSLVMTGAPRDDFVKINYKGQLLDSRGNIVDNFDKYAEDILELPENERQYYRVTDQSQDFQDAYFNTMFYQTFFGKKFGADELPAQYQNYRFNVQMPCTGMKHFYAEYASGEYTPVVIAKYYEGAKVNGTVVFNGEVVDDDLEIVAFKNLSFTESKIMPIEHDNVSSSDGSFDLLLGAGASIQIRKDLGATQFIVHNVTFNGEDGTVFAPITDDVAMRKTSDWKRALGNISIKPAEIKGFVFADEDKNDLLSNITVTATEVDSLTSNSRTGSVSVERYGSVTEENITGEKGYYNISGLEPDYYGVSAKDGSYYLGIALTEVHSGSMFYNFTKPENVTLRGVLYYDSNNNGVYDSGEELSNTKVDLTHDYAGEGYTINPETGQYEQKKESDFVANTTTDKDGWYTFDSILPGKINGVGLNNYTIRVETDLYKVEKSVFPEENQTTTLNVSVDLAPVEVSGDVEYNDENIENKEIEIEFSPDMSVDDAINNTAESKTVTAETDGTYSVELIPGYYNITINHKEGDVLVFTYEESGYKVNMNNTKQTKDIALYEGNKHSATITGYILDENSDVIEKAGVTIDFSADGSEENNPAIVPADPATDSDGMFLVELTHNGNYNISVNYTEGNVIVYTGTGYIDNASEDMKEDITLTKRSATLSGKVTYDGVPVENVNVVFSINKASAGNNAKKPNTGITTDSNGDYTVELTTKGDYNISIDKKAEDGVTTIYSYTGSLDDVSDGQTLNIALTKESVNVSGNTIDNNNSSNIGGIDISFTKNESISNNTATAIDRSTKSNENGHYYIELKPGYYNVSINQISPENATITYLYTGELQVVETTSMTQTENILMTREQD